MKSKQYTFLFRHFKILFFYLLIQPYSQTYGKTKHDHTLHPSQNQTTATATVATKAFIDGINNSQDPQLELSQTDNDYEEKITDLINQIQDLDANINASWIFEFSVKSIKTIFKSDELSKPNNILRTLKQTACVFVAESHYGNLSDKYDQCDQTNIGQIRSPAYKEIFNQCPNYFQSEDLSFLGKGTSCETLHPYELPLCCEAIKKDEFDYGCGPYNNNPLLCISKNKRDFLEASNAMTATLLTTTKLEEGLAEPISCENSSRKKYVRIPAIPTHSIFSSLFYLHLIGYEPMTNVKFAKFGAKRYNAATAKAQMGYQQKLNTCLKIVDEPKNSKIISEAFDRVIKSINDK